MAVPFKSGKNKICYFYHDEIGNYHYGPGHPMKPHRIRLTHDLLNAYGVLPHFDRQIPVAPETSVITTFHTDDYIDFLKHVNSDNIDEYSDRLSRFNVGEDCPVFDGLWDFCQLYTGGSVAAAQQLANGTYQHALNWAGGLHHGKKHEASGFCYVNDCVLAALEFLRYFHRVLYVDIDVHHGDGVEEAFYTSNRVMTVSFHKYGDFFPGTGALEDCGARAGRGYAVNVPLRDGVDDVMYEETFKKVLDLVMSQFQPEAIILQSGGDSLAGDRLGCFNLTLKGHSTAMRYLCGRGIPILALGGGGYTLRNVPKCWAHESALLAGIQLDEDIPEKAEYRHFYAPECKLEVRSSNMSNLNCQKQVNKIIEEITENFRNNVSPVGSQIRISNEHTHYNDPLDPMYRPMGDEDMDVDEHQDGPDSRDFESVPYESKPSWK